ncbi:CHASE2 domain-containing protein [Elusimicrobiota bacterium]
MKKSKQKSTHWYIGLPILGALLFMFLVPGTDFLENKYIDFLFSARNLFWGVGEIDKRLTLVAIDDDSVESIGRWPWPRSVHAKIVNELMSHDPALIVFDVLFPEPDARAPRDDRELIDATKRAKDKVVHAFYENVETVRKGGVSTLKLSVFKPFPALLDIDPHLGFVEQNKYENNILSVSYDSDGMVRRNFMSKQISTTGETALSLGAKAFAMAKGLSEEEFVKSYPDEIIINFPGSFFEESTLGEIRRREPYELISAKDVVSGELKKEVAEKLKGAIIFIASISVGTFDHYPTPFNPVTPGVEMHMYAANSLLNGNALERPHRFMLGTLLMVLLGLLFTWAPAKFSARLNFGMFAGGITLLFIVSLVLMATRNYVLDVSVPAISTFLIFSSITLYRMATEEREKKWIRNTFGQYLSPKVVSLLVENPDALRLGGEKREMTAMFMDIAHFTTISEKLPPEELTKLLNHYLTNFTNIIMKYDGVVDKFIGDAIMAFWNAPFDQADHQLHACLAALEMQEQVKSDVYPGAPPVEIRIGLHTGDMVVGNMGSQSRFNYTAIGDNVNFASRLEGANKFFKTSTLISETVYEKSKKTVLARELGAIRVVGKEKPVSIYELIGKKDDGQEVPKSVQQWNEAIYMLKKGKISIAKQKFTDYIMKHKDDPAANTYMSMMEKGVKGDFTINLTEK